MIDYLTIGSSPSDEDCAQVGSPDYTQRSRKECLVFLHQLERQFGDPPATARLTIKTFPHDFGEYKEVCVIFDNDIEEAVEYALKLEGVTPQTWDEEAKRELKSETLKV